MDDNRVVERRGSNLCIGVYPDEVDSRREFHVYLHTFMGIEKSSIILELVDVISSLNGDKSSVLDF